MELPEDVLRIIKEYSKPITNPYWRTLHIMPYQLYKSECYLVHENRLQTLLNIPYHEYRDNDLYYKVKFNTWNVFTLFQIK